MYAIKVNFEKEKTADKIYTSSFFVVQKRKCIFEIYIAFCDITF